MSFSADLEAFVFMKVGRHAGEDFQEILERKRRELQQSGRIWWGYGSSTLHPLSAVQPFVRYILEQGRVPMLVMQSVVSSHPDIKVYAREYSADGFNWHPIPDGIAVRGSRYALVLDEILPGELGQEIDFSEYRVGGGPSRGKVASDYLRGRVDKGCFTRGGRPNEAVEPKLVTVDFVARLREPYAVLLRD